MAKIKINGKTYVTSPLTWRQALAVKETKGGDERMAEEMVRVALGGVLTIEEIRDLPLETMIRITEEVTSENGVGSG